MKRKILWVFAAILVLVLAIGVNAQGSGSLEEIFEFKGYALSPDGTGISAGFTVNYNAMEDYADQTGKTVEIGAVFASYDELGGMLPLDENGKEIVLEGSNVFKFPLNDYEYLVYDFKITDLTEDLYSHKFVVCPYLYDGENVYYYNEDGVGETVTGISYMEIFKLVHDHTFVNVVSPDRLASAATCTENATYYKICQECGVVSDECFELENTALGHVPSKLAAVAANCTQTGLTEGSYCSTCNEVLVAQTVVPVSGHNYEYVSSKSVVPTLNNEGKKVSYCAGCSTYKTETTGKLTASKVTKDQIYSIETDEYNPALINVWKVVDGNTISSGIYSAENDWFGNVGDVLTITFNQEMYLSSLSVYVAGNWTFASITVKDANGNVTGSGSVNANGGANGGTSSKVDVLTGKNILAYTVEVKITGLKWEDPRTFKLAEIEFNAANVNLAYDHTHVYREITEKIEATCQRNGVEIRTCYCGNEKEYILPISEHTYDTLVSEIAPTCTENGYETYSCVCGATKDVVVTPKGHIYEKFVRYSLEPAYGYDGAAIYQCIGCELREERVVPMLALEELKYLRVAEINGTTVTLKFNILNAPASYEVRYSKDEITSANFQNATVVSATVTGEKEMTVVFNLDASLNNGYYVAIRPYTGENVGDVYSIRVGGNKLIPIDYSDARVYHGETLTSFVKMFDEQYGYNSTPSTTMSRVFTDTNDTLLYGMSLSPIVDLEYMHYVSDVYVYFANSGKTVKIRWSKTPVDFQAEDSAWEGVYTFTSQTGWKAISISQETRYIQIVFEDGFAPSEMLFYGYQSAEGDKITLTDRVNPTMGEMMGMCGFVASGGGNTPIDSVICSTVLREYHNFGWSYDAAAYFSRPSFFYESWMGNFDSQYRDYGKAGLNVIPCIQWKLTTDSISNKVDENNVPIVENGAFVRGNFFDRFNPHTYFTYADNMFAFAARYGSNSSSELAEIAAQRVKSSQLVGLNYIKWIELGNEPDGSWNGVHNYYSAYQYAALLSASYDGHCGTMVSSVLNGANHFGVKSADLNMGVAMAGIAAADCSYVNAMNYWMRANRADGMVAYDAFNGHHYMAKQVTIGNGKTTVGISPEEGDLKGVMSHFVNLRNKYYSDKEVWITEFGWDTNQSYATATSAHAYGEYTGRQVQAMWLTRAYLLLSSAGVDKATMYMCEDAGVEEESAGKYGTCGVIGFERDENGNLVEVKKDSYYYMYTLKNTLGDFRFNREIAAYDENVMIYEYVSDDGRTAYAVWCKTSDGTKSENYQLRIGAESATLVEAVYGDIDGVKTTLTSDSVGCVGINVSENPVYVVVD